MPRVTAIYMGRLRQAFGLERESFTVEETASVFTLRRLVMHNRRQFKGVEQGLIYTISHSQVALNHVLKDGDEVAFIPPDVKTTGGNG